MAAEASPNSSSFDQNMDRLTEEASSLDNYHFQDHCDGSKPAEGEDFEDLIKSYDIKATEILKRLRELKTDSDFKAACSSGEGMDVFEAVLQESRRMIEELREWRKSSGLDPVKVLPVVDELQEMIESLSIIRKKDRTA